jgi:prepilin-type N-terminal cleavage/methylation domain-containing protein
MSDGCLDDTRATDSTHKERNVIGPRTANVSSTRRGFTLLEILVALGAVVVVAVGLASIFRSVGETVSAGRRLSRINQVSKLLEQQLRSDFGRMTRDGFLAIRQGYADRNGNGTFERLTDPHSAV